MRPTDHLKDLNAEDWHATIRHPFTTALADGTLPKPTMLRYLEQDHLF
ncbi:MAG TPA: TENA/THI-4 family protein, partial [Roseovarius sp.]|nr:TENA/THI-4 family protein [Roseovarius sp.]